MQGTQNKEPWQDQVRTGMTALHQSPEADLLLLSKKAFLVRLLMKEREENNRGGKSSSRGRLLLEPCIAKRRWF